MTGPLLDLLVQLRTQVRKEKNFKLADEIRNRLAALGVVLEDRPDGTVWRIEKKGSDSKTCVQRLLKSKEVPCAYLMATPHERSMARMARRTAVLAGWWGSTRA